MITALSRVMKFFEEIESVSGKTLTTQDFIDLRKKCDNVYMYLAEADTCYTFAYGRTYVSEYKDAISQILYVLFQIGIALNDIQRKQPNSGGGYKPKHKARKRIREQTDKLFTYLDRCCMLWNITYDKLRMIALRLDIFKKGDENHE